MKTTKTERDNALAGLRATGLIDADAVYDMAADLDTALARADRSEEYASGLVSDVEAMGSKLDTALARAEGLEREVETLKEAKSEAESERDEVRELRAEVARLKWERGHVRAELLSSQPLWLARFDDWLSKQCGPRATPPPTPPSELDTLRAEVATLKEDLHEALGYVSDYFRQKHFARYLVNGELLSTLAAPPPAAAPSLVTLTCEVCCAKFETRYVYKTPSGFRCPDHMPPCRGCGELLKIENYRVADGCPCNASRGINHGLVPIGTCTCAECDPEQTGSTRWPPAAPGAVDSLRAQLATAIENLKLENRRAEKYRAALDRIVGCTDGYMISASEMQRDIAREALDAPADAPSPRAESESGNGGRGIPRTRRRREGGLGG